jgi:hypothetical protein
MNFSKKIIIESYGDEEDAAKRRINNEWSLGPNCPEVGLQAHALYNMLVNSGEVDDEEFNVYDLIPEGNDYDMRVFGIINSDIDDRKYMVGDEDDTESSAISSTMDLLDDVGIEGLPKHTIESAVDEDGIIDWFVEMFSYDAYQNPESYVDESLRSLTKQQENFIELKELKIKKLERFIESLEEMKMMKKVEEMNDIIDDLRLEILSIKEDPEGDFSDELIEQGIEDRMDDVRSNPLMYARDWDLNLKDYVNIDDLAKYIVDEDGYGHTLNRYDGSEDSEYVLGKLYYIFRID